MTHIIRNVVGHQTIVKHVKLHALVLMDTNSVLFSGSTTDSSS